MLDVFIVSFKYLKYLTQKRHCASTTYAICTILIEYLTFPDQEKQIKKVSDDQLHLQFYTPNKSKIFRPVCSDCLGLT